MKTIGLLGGMSWESTAVYYQTVNEVVKSKLGGLHSAKVVLYSVDFAEIEQYQSNGEWGKSADVLTRAAQSLERAGADFIVICTNTMHKVAAQIQTNIEIPILHIAEATALELGRQRIDKVALLGTKYTMTQAFYTDILRDAGIDVVIPSVKNMELVNSVIYEELCLGTIADASKREFLRIIEECKKQGAQGVILGCTEIGLLIQQKDTDLPVFDTAKIHAATAAMHAICP